MSNVYIAVSNGKSLEHFGTLGMRWYVRRYQNYDGTLTAKGRKRYYSDGTTGTNGLTKKGKELRTTIINQARTNTDLLDAYHEEYRKTIKENDKDLKKLENKRDDQAFKVIDAVEKYEETGSSADRAALDKEMEKFTGDCTALWRASVRKDLELGAPDIYAKYRSQIAERTLKQLGFEPTDKGKEFVENMIASRLQEFHVDSTYVDRSYAEKFAAEYLKEHPNSKLTKDDIMYWLYD